MAGNPHRTRPRLWHTPVLMAAVLALLATSCSTFGQAEPPSSDGTPPDAAPEASPEQEVVEAFAGIRGDR